MSVQKQLEISTMHNESCNEIHDIEWRRKRKVFPVSYTFLNTMNSHYSTANDCKTATTADPLSMKNEGNPCLGLEFKTSTQNLAWLQPVTSIQHLLAYLSLNLTGMPSFFPYPQGHEICVDPPKPFVDSLSTIQEMAMVFLVPGTLRTIQHIPRPNNSKVTLDLNLHIVKSYFVKM